MTSQGKKIGIMGGAFDPIHYGHLLIAENAAAQYGLDQVMFMPTGQSPHKEKQYVADSSHRCEMVRLAIADNPRFVLSLFEIESRKTNYTYRTLAQLREREPENEWYFILGGDSLKDFASWKYPEKILQSANLLTAIRDNMEGEVFQKQIQYLKEHFGAEGIFSLRTPNFTVSSRRIRSLILEGQTVRYMLPEPVRAYILANHLYEKNRMDKNESY